MQDAERDQDLDPARRQRHNLGGIENPIFGEVFRRPATACGSSLLGAGLVAEGAVVYSPAGGLHHGRPDRASGFCYFNDPALAILDLLDRGVDRIAYLDVDAHHGDGVQDAFAGDARVLTVSVHEAQRWPFTGAVEDRGGGNARNLPDAARAERRRDGGACATRRCCRWSRPSGRRSWCCNAAPTRCTTIR